MTAQSAQTVTRRSVVPHVFTPHPWRDLSHCAKCGQLLRAPVHTKGIHP